MFFHLNSSVQAQDMLGFAILAAITITPIRIYAQMLNVGKTITGRLCWQLIQMNNHWLMITSTP